MADIDKKDGLLKKLEEKGSRLTEECEKCLKEIKVLTEKNDHLKATNVELKKNMGGFEKQKIGAEKEQTNLGKVQKKFEADMIKKDQK